MLTTFLSKLIKESISIKVIRGGLAFPIISTESFSLRKQILFSEIRDGSSLVISLEPKCTILNINKIINFEPFTCNVYITPPFSRGFEPHYDLKDQFIYQIYGEKYWIIGKEKIVKSEVNLNSRPNHIKECIQLLKKHSYSKILTSGDSLFLTAMQPHVAFTGAKYSIHVTLEKEI